MQNTQNIHSIQNHLKHLSIPMNHVIKLKLKESNCHKAKTPRI